MYVNHRERDDQRFDLGMEIGRTTNVKGILEATSLEDPLPNPSYEVYYPI